MTHPLRLSFYFQQAFIRVQVLSSYGALQYLRYRHIRKVLVHQFTKLRIWNYFFFHWCEIFYHITVQNSVVKIARQVNTNAVRHLVAHLLKWGFHPGFGYVRLGLQFFSVGTTDSVFTFFINFQYFCQLTGMYAMYCHPQIFTHCETSDHKGNCTIPGTSD